MIASVSGVVKATTLNSAVIEVGGVGLQVALPARFAASLIVGTHAEIFTTLVVREDSLTLFGFDRADSRDFFDLLQTVSGIGPILKITLENKTPSNSCYAGLPRSNAFLK